MKNTMWMLRECQNGCKAAMLPGLRHHIAQKFLMTEMESVEIPKRKDDGTGRTGFIFSKIRNDLHGGVWWRLKGSLFREASPE